MLLNYCLTRVDFKFTNNDLPSVTKALQFDQDTGRNRMSYIDFTKRILKKITIPLDLTPTGLIPAWIPSSDTYLLGVALF
jgi:hypothetical protein